MGKMLTVDLSEKDCYHVVAALCNISIQIVSIQIADDLFPVNPTGADINKKKRFSSYRIFIYWLYPELKRRQRQPLSACLYGLIHARFPPTDNEEIFADWRFSKYADDI